MRTFALTWISIVSLGGCAASALQATSSAPPTTARELIERSIAYHDPDGRWWHLERTVDVTQPRPGDPDPRLTEFVLYPNDARFRHHARYKTHWTKAVLNGDACDVEVSKDSGERFKDFDCNQARMYHRYYSYLFNVPMNLLEGGTLSPNMTIRNFNGHPVLAVRITYGPEEPVWDHFFDPKTYALVGCSFSTGGQEKDGEYIVYQGEAQKDGIRLPRERTWYTWAEGKVLGVDRITRLDFVTP